MQLYLATWNYTTNSNNPPYLVGNIVAENPMTPNPQRMINVFRDDAIGTAQRLGLRTRYEYDIVNTPWLQTVYIYETPDSGRKKLY